MWDRERIAMVNAYRLEGADPKVAAYAADVSVPEARRAYEALEVFGWHSEVLVQLAGAPGASSNAQRRATAR